MPSKRNTSINIWPLILLALALLASGACTADKKAQEELQQEIKELKAEIKGMTTEIKALQEEMGKLEAGQQEIVKLLQNPPAPPLAAAPPPVAAPSPAPEPLSIGQLLKNKELLQGTRVTFRGMPGTVLMHRQTLIMRAPEGAVEVYFGALPDVLTVNRLTSTTLEHPLTVTGIVNIPSRRGGNVKINAEAVEF